MARKIPIDELYVNPGFQRRLRKKDERPELLNASEFLAKIYRAVVLGNPGGGKSTFTLKLCHDLAAYYNDRLFGGRQVSPILVILRDYGAEKKAHGCSLLQFIESIANSKYQVPAPRGAFEYMLLNGRVVVIFDGLDELLETSYRQEVSGDIESFCNLYTAVPVIVTSREVGYEQAPLDTKRFEIYDLAPFTQAQVHEYVEKWFHADTELTPEQKDKKIRAFLDESQIVPDLRSNPLMLALMCNLYRGENYIPRNRPDVYEKCATMLFERWDKARGLFVLLPFESHIRPAMVYLAHWIYSEDALRAGVSEDALVRSATDYLYERRFEDRDDAERAAKEFVEFCRGRAWVFTDTGTTKEGERLYQFTHTTFLEYFTAVHLVRTNPTPELLEEKLLPKIVKQEWDVVAQLAFQLQNKNVEGAGDRLLSALTERSRKSGNGEEQNLLSFVARCLEFMVPSPRVTREITQTVTKLFLSRMIIEKSKRRRKHVSLDSMEVFAFVLNAADENRAPIADTLEKLLVDFTQHGTDDEVDIALEIALNLQGIASFPRPGFGRPTEVPDFWKGVSDRIAESVLDVLKNLCPKNLGHCLTLFYRGNASPSDIVRWHGISSLFRDPDPIAIFGWQSVASGLIYFIINPYTYNSEQYEREMSKLKEVTELLLENPPPWTKKFTSMFRDIYFEELHGAFRQVELGDSVVKVKPEAAAIFGAFLLTACMLENENMNETEKRDRVRQILDRLLKSDVVFLRPLYYSLRARFEAEHKQQAMAEISNVGLSQRQEALVTAWVENKVDFVSSK